MEQEVIEEEVSLFEDGGHPEEKQAVAAAPVEDEAPAFEVPAKFKDKSMEDVITSYVHLEKEYGNKSNEVGELRKWADTLLQAQNNPQPTNSGGDDGYINDDDVSIDDLFDDPTKAVEKALAKNPTIQRMEETIQHQQNEASRATLLAAHPDADEVVVSPEFQTWLMEAPGRQQMLASAHINRNVDVASDMLSMFKATKQVTNAEAVTERASKAKSTLQKASVETGKAPATTRKVYRRAELIHLKMNDPAKYEAMRDEIHSAYAEGRVK